MVIFGSPLSAIRISTIRYSDHDFDESPLLVVSWMRWPGKSVVAVRLTCFAILFVFFSNITCKNKSLGRGYIRSNAENCVKISTKVIFFYLFGAEKCEDQLQESNVKISTKVIFLSFWRRKMWGSAAGEQDWWRPVSGTGCFSWWTLEYFAYQLVLSLGPNAKMRAPKK